MLRQPVAVLLPHPIVDLEVAIERRAAQPETLLRVIFESVVLQRAIELLVADHRELAADAEISDLDSLQVALQKVRDPVRAQARRLTMLQINRSNRLEQLAAALSLQVAAATVAALDTARFGATLRAR
jgi:hypothetical protein